MKHFQIYSSYDGWSIQLLDGNKIEQVWSWDHEDIDLGVGGEGLFQEILEYLGHTTYHEDVC